MFVGKHNKETRMSAEKPKRTERPGVDRDGRTPLYYAAVDKDVMQVEALLSSGLDPNAVDDSGWTPLHFAARVSAPEVVKLLLAAGATVDPRDSDGNTPLWRAVFSSRGEGEVIRLLRAAGADPYIDNKHGSSPLKAARLIANYDVRQFFRDLPE
jgi:ankyrin repeat protein